MQIPETSGVESAVEAPPQSSHDELSKGVEVGVSRDAVLAHSRPIRLSGSTVTYPLTSASIHTTHGWYLRLPENRLRDLEHYRYTLKDISVSRFV